MKENDAGFTLLETVMSLTIIAISFGVLFATFGTADKRVATSEQRQVAVAVAEARLDDFLTVLNMDALPITGSVENMAWRVEGIEIEQEDGNDRADPRGRLITLRSTVTWQSLQEQSITFERVAWLKE